MCFLYCFHTFATWFNPYCSLKKKKQRKDFSFDEFSRLTYRTKHGEDKRREETYQKHVTGFDSTEIEQRQPPRKYSDIHKIEINVQCCRFFFLCLHLN